jgi:hypothetical protein
MCEGTVWAYQSGKTFFYNDLHESLTKKMNFEQNAYDPCINNKRTKNGSITIRTHVDDLKVSKRSKVEMEKVIEALRDIYEEITVHHGTEHDYLGMIMDYNKEAQSVTINMRKCIEDCIEEFESETPEVVLKDVATPATENLFKTKPQGEEKYLDGRRAAVFHPTIAKLLFVAKRGRQDILLAVSFLTTRVKMPDEDDWKKLIRLLSYLKHSLEYMLTLSCRALDKLSWYIDGSYAVHQDMKGHSGSVLVTGGCVVLTGSN